MFACVFRIEGEEVANLFAFNIDNLKKLAFTNLDASSVTAFDKNLFHHPSLHPLCGTHGEADIGRPFAIYSAEHRACRPDRYQIHFRTQYDLVTGCGE